jgi:hypothetical protein
MRKYNLLVWMGLLMASLTAAAQTVTGSGTGYFVPVFTGSGTSSTIGNSSIYQGSGGNVVISSPASVSPLLINYSSWNNGLVLNNTNGANGGSIGFQHSGNWTGAVGDAKILVGGSSNDLAIIGYSGSGLQFGVNNPATPSMVINTLGNVGIGTTAPAYKLDVSGQIHTAAGVVFPDGSIQTVAYTGTCGADYAEAVDVTGDRTKYEPGDILVIDPDAPGKFLKSNQAYSTLVAGIYSTKPGFVGRKQPSTPETSATEVPMAMVGRVPTKVSAENGPIKVGDLLVSSSTIGYAMKGTDRSLLTGAVVGKALGSLDSGTGVIEVLVTLQ